MNEELHVASELHMSDSQKEEISGLVDAIREDMTYVGQDGAFLGQAGEKAFIDQAYLTKAEVISARLDSFQDERSKPNTWPQLFRDVAEVPLWANSKVTGLYNKHLDVTLKGTISGRK